MLLSKFAVCNLLKIENTKKQKFIKGQEASELLSSFRVKARLNKISLLGPLLFQYTTS